MQSLESPQELQQKLDGYHEQLGQIEELLAQDSTNESFLRLKADLHEVIKLTSDLLNIQTGSATATPTVAPVVNHADDIRLSYQEADATIGVGSRVEALQSDSWQPAIVRDILDDGEQFIVGFYSNLDEGETVHSAMVRPIQRAIRLVELDTLTVGSQVTAKWAADGLYYDATVASLTPNGVTVSYDGYGYTSHVPPEYLAVRTRQTQSTQQSHTQRTTATNKKADHDTSSKELVIPENLKILPTDTEKEKERKRKKIKALKNKARIRGQEEESTEKQSSWQSFVSKGKNRRTGFITTKRKESIFASPDTVEGRVGVTGSGQGMTDFDKRKKHKAVGAPST